MQCPEKGTAYLNSRLGISKVFDDREGIINKLMEYSFEGYIKGIRGLNRDKDSL